MQLFTIGLNVLNDDGTPVIDPATGSPFETYTNEDIESFARAWTGFDRAGVRGNYEETRRGSADNMLDPMRVRPEWRDVREVIICFTLSLIVDAIDLTLHSHLILGLPQEQLEPWIHRRWILAMC
jgi:hypothetical protein